MAIGCLLGCSAKFNQGVVNGAVKASVPEGRVQLFPAGSPPPENFEVVTALSIEGYTPSTYQTPMRTKAGKLGADAVINVHNFDAPRIIGTRLQSGIAVRLIPEAGSGPAEAQSGVAIMVLVEAVPNDPKALSAIQDTIEVAAATQLHYRGYCPIRVTARMPSGIDVPTRATFDLLRGTEASVCEKMLVLRLTGRQQVNAGVIGWAHFKMTAELVSRRNNQVIWTHTDTKTQTGLGIYRAISATSSAQVYEVVGETLKRIPKNELTKG